MFWDDHSDLGDLKLIEFKMPQPESWDYRRAVTLDPLKL